MPQVHQELFNFLSIILQLLTAAGLIYFAWRQTQINKRMQELSDYVAISIIPLGNKLQIINVGRVNLYIHKWEIGSATETYVKPWLIPIDAKSSVMVSLQSPQPGQHLVKIYLTDDSEKKYLSTGEVVVEPIGFQMASVVAQPQASQESQQTSQTASSPQLTISFQMRAWSYKTERYEWTI